VGEDWAAGTPAGDGGSECENVAMMPLATRRNAQAMMEDRADQCIVVVHN